MNTKYLQFVERALTTALSRAEGHTKDQLKLKSRLLEDFSHAEGPGWSSNSNVFAHVIHEAKAQACSDMARLFNAVLTTALTHEAATADIKVAIDNAQERLNLAKAEIVKALSNNLVPADQIGWIAHQARIEVLTDYYHVFGANSPEEFEIEASRKNSATKP